ncbi:MAG: hypothetical protein JO125_16295 [Chloroflexi bacterium]|nr:hypothetical protein [Ktedonobacteraceae bacterium]MBV9019884.1 hypothetical protein [Ktedonobacteraceae bacterium]MBV9708956.1 hypothetical protein [Chloroflexota bacterium]
MGYVFLGRVLALLVLLVLTTSCSQSTSGVTSSGPQSPCDRSSSIKGSIASISSASSGRLVGSFLLDGSKEKQAAYDQVYVQVPSSTQVYEKQASGCQTVPFTALKKGQRVQIQSTGIATQSDPPRIEAAEILLLAPQT